MNIISRLINILGLRISHSKVFSSGHILFNYFIFLDTIICFIKFQNFQLYIGNIRNKFFPFTTSVKNFLCLSFLPIHPIVNAMLNSVKCVYCITLKFHMKLLSINCLNNLFNLRLLGSWECSEHNLLKNFKPFFKSFLPLSILSIRVITFITLILN